MNNLVRVINSFFSKDEDYELMTVLSNTSAIIYQLYDNINWVGFYLLKNDILHLGPFQGKPACMKIPLNKGVCGYSARNKKSIIVNDVHNFEGHIACDSASNSELVIPIIINNTLFGLLDIDSPSLNRFTDDDLLMFQTIIDSIIPHIKK